MCAKLNSCTKDSICVDTHDLQFHFCSQLDGLHEKLDVGATNVTFQQHKVTRAKRGLILGQYPGFRGCTVWFTGLSGAGKTTIAFGVEKVLTDMGLPTYALDGDNVRHGLCKNLGFSQAERAENIRRVAEVSKLFADIGVIALASFISPFRVDRLNAKKIHDDDDLPFYEVFVATSLEICESRDPKNLYKKARAGFLKGFTGIDSVYEEPLKPNLILQAGEESEQQCVQRLIDLLRSEGIIPQKAWERYVMIECENRFMQESEKIIYHNPTISMPSVNITRIDLEWLQVLSEGWAWPLKGFMRERQFLQCIHHGMLFDLKRGFSISGPSNDPEDESLCLDEPLNQTIPIVLPISTTSKENLINDDGVVSSEIILKFEGKAVAVLCNSEIYEHRKVERVARQFGFLDTRHPVINQIMESGDWLLGGEIQVFERIRFNDDLDAYRLTPQELRDRFEQAGCDAVFVFQLRNPVHNGHALLMRETREKLLTEYKNPMLLLHPLGGWTKEDDVPLHVRIKQHEAVLEDGILDPQWTILSIFPSPMLYAGPVEVQWHARARLAVGASIYIVGRDPAGLPHPDTGDYLYDPTHGAKVLSMAPGLRSLKIFPFKVAAYDKVNGRMDFYDESRKADFIFISGTKMRGFARDNVQPPDGFMSPKAWKILSDYYQSLRESS